MFCFFSLIAQIIAIALKVIEVFCSKIKNTNMSQNSWSGLDVEQFEFFRSVLNGIFLAITHINKYCWFMSWIGFNEAMDLWFIVSYHIEQVSECQIETQLGIYLWTETFVKIPVLRPNLLLFCTVFPIDVLHCLITVLIKCFYFFYYSSELSTRIVIYMKISKWFANSQQFWCFL